MGRRTKAAAEALAIEVQECMDANLTKRETAELLGVSPDVVRHHYTKLGGWTGAPYDLMNHSRIIVVGIRLGVTPRYIDLAIPDSHELFQRHESGLELEAIKSGSSLSLMIKIGGAKARGGIVRPRNRKYPEQGSIWQIRVTRKYVDLDFILPEFGSSDVEIQSWDRATDTLFLNMPTVHNEPKIRPDEYEHPRPPLGRAPNIKYIPTRANGDPREWGTGR